MPAQGEGQDSAVAPGLSLSSPARVLPRPSQGSSPISFCPGQRRDAGAPAEGEQRRHSQVSAFGPAAGEAADPTVPHPLPQAHRALSCLSLGAGRGRSDGRSSSFPSWGSSWVARGCSPSRNPPVPPAVCEALGKATRKVRQRSLAPVSRQGRNHAVLCYFSHSPLKTEGYFLSSPQYCADRASAPVAVPPPHLTHRQPRSRGERWPAAGRANSDPSLESLRGHPSTKDNTSNRGQVPSS